MGEADPAEILLVDKERKSAERLRDVEGVQSALDLIGSVQNITLTQLARTRRVLFTEGKNDFKRIRRFARHLDLNELVTGLGLTPVESGGFSTWEKIEALAWGIEKTLGEPIRIGAIFDSDFRCEAESEEIESKLKSKLQFACVLKRKEMENYFLVPDVLDIALRNSILERSRRKNEEPQETEPMEIILGRISDRFRKDALAQYISQYTEYHEGGHLDASTLTTQAIDWFDSKWSTLGTRMEIVPGKVMLSALREHVAEEYSVNLTDIRIIDAFSKEQIPTDMLQLLHDLERFRST